MDPYRPQLHLTATSSWINDPNGLVARDGVYHAFYQCNPFGSEWGNMSWGHSVSPDLVSWEHLPVALAIRTEPGSDESTHIYSGTIAPLHPHHGLDGVPDEAGLVACYTAHSRIGDEVQREVQELAWSTDEGRTWTEHPGNPVLDRGRKDFRDPRLWHDPEHDQWVMVVAAPRAASVEFYTSSNGLDWTLSSVHRHSDPAAILECPDLQRMSIEGSSDRRWLLVYSVGHPTNAESGRVVYQTGEWTGREFVPDPGGPRIVDDGRDFFALQFFAGLPADETPIGLAWVNSWPYAGALPTQPWRGALSLPRRFHLERNLVDGEVVLCQRPHENVIGLVGAEVAPGALVEGPFRVSVAPGAATAGRVWIEDEAGGRLVLELDAAIGRASLDRSAAGDVAFHPAFAGVEQSTYRGVGGVEIYVDGCVVEVFLDNGLHAITSLCFFAEGPRRVSSDGNLDVSVRSMALGHR